MKYFMKYNLFIEMKNKQDKGWATVQEITLMMKNNYSIISKYFP